MAFGWDRHLKTVCSEAIKSQRNRRLHFTLKHCYPGLREVKGIWMTFKRSSVLLLVLRKTHFWALSTKRSPSDCHNERNKFAKGIVV